MIEVPPTVADEEDLHRAINLSSNAVRDGKVHYMAFYSSSEPWRISVDRAAYRSAADSIAGRQSFALARLNAGRVRGIRLDPHPALDVIPLPENGNDAHAEITASNKVSKNQMKTLVCQRLAEISVPPEL